MSLLHLEDGNDVYITAWSNGTYTVKITPPYWSENPDLWVSEFDKDGMRQFAAELAASAAEGEEHELIPAEGDDLAGYVVDGEASVALSNLLLEAIGDKKPLRHNEGNVKETHRISEHFVMNTSWVPGLHSVFCKIRCPDHPLEDTFGECDRHMTAYNGDMARRKIREMIELFQDLLR